MKHYYALSDWFTKDDPKEYTSGFANTKEPIAFNSKKERDEWVNDTKLLTARSITRDEARSYATVCNIFNDGKRRVRMYGARYIEEDSVIL